MTNPEKDIAEQVLAGSNLTPEKLGLRFDRVVGRMLGDLRTFADGELPAGAAVVVTLSAPIRLPTRTLQALRDRIEAALSADATSKAWSGSVHGNAVQVRVVNLTARQRPKLVGFVHNPGSDPGRLLDLAEHWLQA